MSCGPVLFVCLACAGDRQRHRRNIVRDGRARGGVCAVAHGDRRDQIRVAADEGVVADGGAVLFCTVVVDRDRSAAEIDVLSDVTVADIGQMRDLRPVVDDRVLELDKVAHLDVVSNGRM